MTNLALKLCDDGYARPDTRSEAPPPRPAWLSDFETVLDRAKNGRICVLADSERPDSGAILFVPAQMATPAAITFMACHGRGLICLGLTSERAAALRLERMPRAGLAYSGAAFATSIEARTGVSTGISALDRARTIAVAIDSVAADDALVSPGHVFPVIAQPGGTLSKPGHAEAVVDLARLAGLNPAGVFCVLLNDRGDVARPTDFAPFVEKHGLAAGSIQDLVRYRLRHDRDVVRVKSTVCSDGRGGRWDAVIYRHAVSGVEALALVGEGPRPERVPLYIDYRSSSTAMIASLQGEEAPRLLATQRIARPGSITILLDRKFSEEDGQADITAITMRNGGAAHRDRRLLCAQILADLGVTDIDVIDGSAIRAADLAEFRSARRDGRP